MNMGTIVIHYLTTKNNIEHKQYAAQTQTQAAAIIAAAFVSGTVLRIEFKHL